jgi:hypothetical protein
MAYVDITDLYKEELYFSQITYIKRKLRKNCVLNKFVIDTRFENR